MSTTTETGGATPQPAAVEKDDPWRYGSRYLRREGPDGAVSYEEVPLRKEDLLHPEEGDRPVLTEGHVNDCSYLRDVFKTWAAGKLDALVLSDHRVDWQVPGLRPLGPDVVVFRNVHRPWDPERGTFPVADFGARTLLVIEVTSPDTRVNDLGIKVGLYHRAGVPFYAVVDRHQTRGGLDLRLLGYRADPADPTQYAHVAPDERGRLWLDQARMWLAAENGRAVCYDEQGNRIPDYPQLAVDARAAVDRIKELEAELQRLRAQAKGGPPNPATP